MVTDRVYTIESVPFIRTRKPVQKKRIRRINSTQQPQQNKTSSVFLQDVYSMGKRPTKVDTENAIECRHDACIAAISSNTKAQKRDNTIGGRGTVREEGQLL